MAFRRRRDDLEPAAAMNTRSELDCEVCGHHALVENTVHEYADSLGDRWICQACGAHRTV